MISAAIFLSLLGLGILRYSWGLPQRNRWLNFLAWALIASSLLSWGADGGADRGVALGLCLFVILALTFVLREALAADMQAKKETRRRVRSQNSVSGPALVSFKGIGLFIVNGPLLGVISFAAAMAFHELMLASGAHASNSLVLALFLFPIVWAVLVSYSMISASLSGRVFTFVALPTLSAIALFTGN